MRKMRRQWLPVALCCVPGIVAVGVVALGFAIGGAAFRDSFDGPLGLGVVTLALLACPVSMGLMMWRAQNQSTIAGRSSVMTSCCGSDRLATADGSDLTDRLQALRVQREALEREVADLRTR